MANTVTNLTETIVGDTILPALKLGLAPLNAMSFKAEGAGKPLYVGNSVVVDVVSAKSAGTYTTTFESGDSTSTGVSVTITGTEFSSWHINPRTEGQPTAERFLALGKESTYAVAKGLVQDVLALYVDANIGSGAGDKTIITASAVDVDDYADLKKLLQDKGEGGSISAIMNTAYAAGMSKDAALQDASAYGNNSLISTGELPPVLGMRNYFTDAFPTALTNENVGIIFTGKTTAAVAIGVSGDPTGQEADAGVREMTVTDEPSGISMNWRTWVNSATGVHWGSVYLMYGVKFIQDDAVRIISA